MSSLAILRPGPLALLQDRGRPGLAALGITASGAFDRVAFRSGAALVGNDPAGTDAAIEVILGGLAVRAVGPVSLAMTGAPAPATIGALPAPYGRAFTLADGDELALGVPPRGVRSYLSVRGGLLAEPEFGSRSRDLLAQLGPPPLRAGDVLAVGPAHWQPGADGTLPPDFPGVLDVLPGPRTDWLAYPAALARGWEVSPQSDRVGVRLRGEPLAWAPRRVGTELPSEPVVRGAIQLPPSGLPVLFGPDHPTTGGYPVVGVIADPDRLAQLRPGDRITLRWQAPS